MNAEIKQSAKSKTRNRAIFALFLTPLLVPLTLFISSHLQSQPVFKAPADARVLVSKRNPFARFAGPVYFERLASSRQPKVFWEQMKQVFREKERVEFGSELNVLGGNGSESRDHHQESFKVLGVPQIAMSYPRFQSYGLIRGAHFKIYLWADGRGGSIIELWVMDKF